MDYTWSLLKQREKENRPICVAIVGAGWFGGGVIQELFRWPGVEPKVIFARNSERAVEKLVSLGVAKNRIAVVRSSEEFFSESKKDRYVVCENTNLIKELKNIDLVFDATGSVLLGAQLAVSVIEQGIHFVTISSELDATIGHILHRKAQEKGVVYSNCDGDQPGVIARLMNEVESMGFQTVVAGSCKGFIDVHKNPEDIMPWVKAGHNPRMVASFTDGTKQSLELAALANGTGLIPDKRGMHGPRVTKQTLVNDFMNILSCEGVGDYVMGIDGIDQGAGVFVVAKREGDVAADLEYLKKGKGPYYLFFRDHHLCYFEAPRTIVEAVLLKVPVLAPGEWTSDVLSVAKKNLKKGEQLDGIGGYTVYGLIDRSEIVQKEKLLPVGLTEYAVVARDLAQDTPITYDIVDFPEDNLVLQLRRELEQFGEKVK